MAEIPDAERLLVRVNYPDEPDFETGKLYARELQEQGIEELWVHALTYNDDAEGIASTMRNKNFLSDYLNNGKALHRAHEAADKILNTLMADTVLPNDPLDMAIIPFESIEPMLRKQAIEKSEAKPEVPTDLAAASLALNAPHIMGMMATELSVRLLAQDLTKPREKLYTAAEQADDYLYKNLVGFHLPVEQAVAATDTAQFIFSEYNWINYQDVERLCRNAAAASAAAKIALLSPYKGEVDTTRFKSVMAKEGLQVKNSPSATDPMNAIITKMIESDSSAPLMTEEARMLRTKIFLAGLAFMATDEKHVSFSQPEWKKYLRVLFTIEDTAAEKANSEIQEVLLDGQAAVEKSTRLKPSKREKQMKCLRQCIRQSLPELVNL